MDEKKRGGGDKGRSNWVVQSEKKKEALSNQNDQKKRSDKNDEKRGI